MSKIEIQGKIINNSIKVEHLINQILVLYFKPKNSVLFLTHVCNSSVMHFGGKIKVLTAIGLDKKHSEKLQKLGAIRNSFAHANPSENYASYFSDSQEQFTLSVMNSAGAIKEKGLVQLHEEFNELFTELDLALQNLKLQLSN